MPGGEAGVSTGKPEAGVDTYLPIFPGFYGTDFDEGDGFLESEMGEGFLESYPELADIPEGFVKEHFWDCVNYYMGNLGVAQSATKAVESLLSGYVESIEFQELKRPKEYNFENDWINVRIVPKTGEISRCVEENWDGFVEWIRKRYSHRDGFMSFHPSDAAEWRESTKGFVDFSGNPHYLGAVLDFIATVEGEDDDRLLEEFDASEAFSNSVVVDTSRLIDRWEALEAEG
jgi:hypothetical protein